MQDSHLNYGDDLLQLGYKPKPGGQVEPVVEIYWQPTAKAVELLAEARATEAQLLIVTEVNGREADRLLVPLETGRWFVALRSAGVNNIHACIVWSDDPQDRSAKRLLMKKNSHREYELDVLGEYRPAVLAIDSRIQAVEQRLNTNRLPAKHYRRLDAQLNRLQRQRDDALNTNYEHIIRPDMFEYLREHGATYQLGRAKFGLDVPAQMFAQSWRITEKLGNLFFKNARDQCQLRRRAILTGITAPIWIPVSAIIVAVIFILAYLVGAAVVVIFSIWGSRGLRFAYFNWNNEAGPSHIYADRQPSRWWTRKVEVPTPNGGVSTTYPPRHDFFYLVNPPTILAAALVVVAEMIFGVEGWWLTTPFVVVALILGAIILIGSLIDHKQQTEAREEQQPTEVVRQQVLDRYSVNSANYTARTPTLQLRYLETKAKLCKPFAR